MTNEYISNQIGNNPTITARDLGHYRSRAERRSAVPQLEMALMSTTPVLHACVDSRRRSNPGTVVGHQVGSRSRPGHQ
jgi:hypothetical protein